MSYPMDLDDYTDQELLTELKERAEKRAMGLCDYCGRKPTTSPCKYPKRHQRT